MNMVYPASCTVFLGAGFSHAAGLPLAATLFDCRTIISSQEARHRFGAVWKAWDKWKEENPGLGSEQFLAKLHSSTTLGVHWTWAVELIGAVLATPLSDPR